MISVNGISLAPFNATQLQGRTLATTAPTDAQALVWNQAQSRWEPGTVSGGGGGAPSVASDDMSGTGWATATATGGAAASWATSPARLLLNCAPGSDGSCGVESTTRLPSTDTYDVAIRVRFDVGDGSANGRVLFVVGRDSANCLVLTLSAAGALQAGRTVGGSYTGYTVLYDAGIDSNARTGGQLWVRASRSPQGFVWLWGLGEDDELPTEWVEYWASAQLAASSGYSYTVVANGLSQGPFVGIYLVTVSAIDVDASVLDLVTGLPGAFGGA
jgi:hypothetical protein